MPDRSDPNAVVNGVASVSDKIRALDRAGYSRAEIAAFLGKRYQHVRNVLVDDARRAHERPSVAVEPPASPYGGVAEPKTPFLRPSATSAVSRLEVSRDGRLRLPPSLMATLGVTHGGNIVASVDEDGSVSLLSAQQSLQRARALLNLDLPPDVSLVDELIADRRAEVDHER